MPQVTVQTLAGTRLEIGEEKLETLQQSLRGTVCLPGESGYEEARTLWNVMIDRKASYDPDNLFRINQNISPAA